MLKLFFYNFRPLILASKIDQQIMFFFKPLLAPPFSHVFFDFFQKWLILGPPFEIRWGQKSAPGPLKDPAERVCTVFASRCFPILHCTLPHITFSLGCRRVLGAADFQTGSQNHQNWLLKWLFFQLLQKS